MPGDPCHPSLRLPKRKALVWPCDQHAHEPWDAEGSTGLTLIRTTWQVSVYSSGANLGASSPSTLWFQFPALSRIRTQAARLREKAPADPLEQCALGPNTVLRGHSSSAGTGRIRWDTNPWAPLPSRDQGKGGMMDIFLEDLGFSPALCL